jgi:hypothetical protein
MELALGRLVLAAVFGPAAAAKLADRGGGRRALMNLGVPQRFATIGAVVVPFVELGVAAALLVRPWAEFGAAGALGLLVVFSTVVAVGLGAGRTPDCHCFGRLHSSPIGPATLVRNGVLAAQSLLVLAGGPDAALALVTLTVAAGLGRTLLIALRRQMHRATHHAAEATGATVVSRRRALGLAAMTVAGAVLGPRLLQTTACGAECRSSADCPGTCRNCKKQPGVVTGHCH